MLVEEAHGGYDYDLAEISQAEAGQIAAGLAARTGRRTQRGCPGSPRPIQSEAGVDAAYYEDLAGRLYGLLIMLEGRLGAGQARLLHHFIEVGEYGLALEEIADALAQDQIAITDAEREDMLALADRMKMDDLVPRALGCCPRAR